MQFQLCITTPMTPALHNRPGQRLSTTAMTQRSVLSESPSYSTTRTSVSLVSGNPEKSPYAAVVASSGPMAKSNPFRFSTKWWDEETGLGWWGMRWYSPEMGKWLSRDPIGERGGMCLYGYISNDALNDIDPVGQKSSGVLGIFDLIFDNVIAPWIVRLTGELSVAANYTYFGPTSCPEGQTLAWKELAHFLTFRLYETYTPSMKIDDPPGPDLSSYMVFESHEAVVLTQCICPQQVYLLSMDEGEVYTEWEWITGLSPTDLKGSVTVTTRRKYWIKWKEARFWWPGQL